MYIIFYGSEGSGKSTQAKMLAKKLKLPYLGSGDLVREYSQKDKGVMGDICREALTKGYYVADSEMYVLWKHRLKQEDLQNGWVLDGFPRNPSQAEFLEDKLDKYGKKINAVFYLKVREKESIKRLLKRGRLSPDGELHDSQERINERLKMYRKGENGVLNLYKKKGILVNVDGEKTIDQIFKTVLQKVKNLS
ncbi:adenylate kinase family protein [Patescibacteria group bacterium]